jgi:hypothetical protein
LATTILSPLAALPVATIWTLAVPASLVAKLTP